MDSSIKIWTVVIKFVLISFKSNIEKWLFSIKKFKKSDKKKIKKYDVIILYINQMTAMDSIQFCQNFNFVNILRFTNKIQYLFKTYKIK